MNKRTFATVAALAAVTLAALAGCGDDKKSGSTNGLFRSGTWTFTATATGTRPGDCATGPQTFSLDMPLCEDQDPTAEFSDGCDGDYSGNTVAFDCSESSQDGPCFVTTRTVGSGTFTETTFNITAQVFETASQGEGCVAAPCTTTVAIVGTWKNSTGACAPGYIGLKQILGPALEKAGLRR